MPWLRGLDKDVSRKMAEKSESTALDNNVGTDQVRKKVRANSTDSTGTQRTRAFQKASPTLDRCNC